jgi:GTP cyclohydrolase I
MTDPLSEQIRIRMLSANAPCFANDTVAEFLGPGEAEALESEVADRVADLLRSLVIDIEADHNTRDTPKRVAKMFMREVFAGRYQPRPPVTDFPNVKRLDELYTVGPITVRSACAHHLCPIVGRAWCGVIPGDRLIGLSKFHRLTDWVMSRPQIQEEAVVMLADEIEQLIRPRGLAVVVKATHACMTWRGVRESGETVMTTSVMRGAFWDKPEARAEFLALAGFA